VRVIFLVIDGLADRPAHVLNGSTPLEAASTPNLDAIVSRGSGGLHCSLGHGVPPGTDTAHFVFFGNRLADYPGRALFEAGRDVRIGEVVDLLAGLAGVQVTTRADASRLRPSDVPVLRGSAARFRAATGWEPRIPFAQSMADLLAWWRSRVAAPPDARR